MAIVNRTVALVLAGCCCVAVAAQSLSPTDRTAQFLESARNNPAALMDFLARLPKGGDLHHHLTGAVYAESYIDYAVEDGDCFDAGFAIVAPPCDPAKGLSPASRAITDYDFRNLAIDALSVRNFAPTPTDHTLLGHF